MTSFSNHPKSSLSGWGVDRETVPQAVLRVMNGKRYDQVIMDLLRHELTPEHLARFQSLESA